MTGKQMRSMVAHVVEKTSECRECGMSCLGLEDVLAELEERHKRRKRKRKALKMRYAISERNIK